MSNFSDSQYTVNLREKDAFTFYKTGQLFSINGITRNKEIIEQRERMKEKSFRTMLKKKIIEEEKEMIRKKIIERKMKNWFIKTNMVRGKPSEDEKESPMTTFRLKQQIIEEGKKKALKDGMEMKDIEKLDESQLLEGFGANEDEMKREI